MSTPQSWIVVEPATSTQAARDRGLVGSDTVRDLLLGDDRDLVVENGDLVLAVGVASVAQDVEMRLKMFLGEWEWNLAEGTPMFQEILVKKPNLVGVRARLRERIEGTVGISEMTQLSLDYENATRHLRVKWRAKTDLGELIAGATEVAP
jgi:hypothetical protein